MEGEKGRMSETAYRRSRRGEIRGRKERPQKRGIQREKGGREQQAERVDGKKWNDERKGV